MDPLSCTAPDTPWATLILSASLQGKAVDVDKVKAEMRLLLVQGWCKVTNHLSHLKYRFWLLRCLSMASREPIPRYFFSRIPSEKKYSPGASVVAARREPIMTMDRWITGGRP